MLGLRFSSSWGIDHTEPTPGFGQSGKTAAQLFPVKPLLARTCVQRSNFRKLYTGWNHWQLNHVESCLQLVRTWKISLLCSIFLLQDPRFLTKILSLSPPLLSSCLPPPSKGSRTPQGYFHTAIASTSESWRVTAMPSQSNMGP